MGGTVNPCLVWFEPRVRSKEHYASVAERSNAGDCKSSQPLVQIQPGVPVMGHLPGKHRDCLTLVKTSDV